MIRAKLISVQTQGCGGEYGDVRLLVFGQFSDASTEFWK